MNTQHTRKTHAQIAANARKPYADALAKISAQRADLLAALRGFLEVGYYPETLDAARAAIAKATEI